MTPTEINIAIAEWRTGRYDNYAGYRSIEDLEQNGHDYYHDLNAMHEARQQLTTDQQYEFLFQLGKVTGIKEQIEQKMFVVTQHEIIWTFTNASPDKQCEAFLRTIGKWKE